MGWAYCGLNTHTGDEMGYGVEGVCAHPECDAKIDHGLSYLCGDMHADDVSCNRYFCGKHLAAQRCAACWKLADEPDCCDGEGCEDCTGLA